ncbi:MAG: MBL fold metallo-hydrolase [Deltaproteobacteria bacterium]|nr:MBL fold metallo-hydrolase [Deltaproteobacteria bacterium]
MNPKQHLKVTILGSGTCVPSLERSSCSVLLEIDNQKMVIDMGPGTMQRLLRAETTISQISHIFLSHFHPDHSGELVPFLFASKYPVHSRRQTPLTIIAGNGFRNFFSGLGSVFGEWIDIGVDLLDIVELDNSARQKRSFDGFTLESMPVKHREESLAYRITAPRGASVVYSGDTDVCDSLVEIARDADLFICESAFPDDFKKEGHLTPSRAGEIAARSNVRKLVLTHFYPECETVDIEKECRKTYSGPLVLAQDLMEFQL